MLGPWTELFDSTSRFATHRSYLICASRGSIAPAPWCSFNDGIEVRRFEHAHLEVRRNGLEWVEGRMPS